MAEQLTEQLYKILIIGDATVGKTSFMQRYVWDVFPHNYKATVGVDFYIKVIKWSDTSSIKLQLWDIAGQERFSAMTRVYYKDAHACVIMFDITNRKSFCNVVRWKQDLDSKCTSKDGDPLPCILLANKIDLSKDRQVETSEVETLCRDLQFVGWNETSTKERTRVDQSMSFILGEILTEGRSNGTCDDISRDIQLRETSDDGGQSKCDC